MSILQPWSQVPFDDTRLRPDGGILSCEGTNGDSHTELYSTDYEAYPPLVFVLFLPATRGGGEGKGARGVPHAVRKGDGIASTRQ